MDNAANAVAAYSLGVPESAQILIGGPSPPLCYEVINRKLPVASVLPCRFLPSQDVTVQLPRLRSDLMSRSLGCLAHHSGKEGAMRATVPL